MIIFLSFSEAGKVNSFLNHHGLSNCGPEIFSRFLAKKGSKSYTLFTSNPAIIVVGTLKVYHPVGEKFCCDISSPFADMLSDDCIFQSSFNAKLKFCSALF